MKCATYFILLEFYETSVVKRCAGKAKFSVKKKLLAIVIPLVWMRDWLPEVMQCCVSCRGRQACCVVSRLEAPVQGRVFLVGAGLLASLLCL